MTRWDRRRLVSAAAHIEALPCHPRYGAPRFYGATVQRCHRKSVGRVNYRDFTTEILRHGVLLVVGAPCQPRTLAGQEHGRTIPLGDIDG